jgi:hypothetical protein
MDPVFVMPEDYGAYTLDLLDAIEACRDQRQMAVALGDTRRAAYEERRRNKLINDLERVFAELKREKRRSLKVFK